MAHEIAEANTAKATADAKKKDVQKTTSGFEKPTAVSTSTGSSAQTVTVAAKPPTAQAAGNRIDREITAKLQKEQAAASRRTYEENQKKFNAPPTPVYAESSKGGKPTTVPAYTSNPTYTSTRVYGEPSYEDVYVKRRTVYRNWNRPVYIHSGSSSYGTWDAVMLWYVLQHDPLFGYHHRNDASYRAWRRDAERLARDNEVLRLQLLEQDRQNLRYESERLAHNARYLPAVVSDDPLLALSDEAIKSLPVSKPLLRVATGVEGGKYYQVGEALRAKAGKDFDVELVPTSGSAENFKLLQSGKVDAAIVQSDTCFVTHQLKVEGSSHDAQMHEGTLYCEYVTLVVSKDSSIKSVKDLKSGNTVYVGPEGSGSALTWSGIVMQNGQYAGVKTEKLDYQAALDRVSKDRNAALIFVAGSDAPLLRRAASSGQYRLVPVDDEKLHKIEDNSGDEVYSSLTITSSAYPGMQNGEIQTLAVEAVWTLSDAWIKRFGDSAFDKVNYAVRGVISDLHIENLKASPFTLKDFFWWVGLPLVIIVGIILFATKVNVTR